MIFRDKQTELHHNIYIIIIIIVMIIIAITTTLTFLLKTPLSPLKSLRHALGRFYHLWGSFAVLGAVWGSVLPGRLHLYSLLTQFRANQGSAAQMAFIGR